jgi:hypothetical protein
MANEQVIQQGGNERKQKGIADIVFCIDASGSMSSVIEGLKQNIENFVDNLDTNQQISSLDLRLGILAHDQDTFYKLNLTNSISDFKGALRKIETGADEFTLPALDWALDFPWRKATRIVVAFTDEPLRGGHDVALQKSKIEELMKKIGQLRVCLFFVGMECSEYKQIIEYTPKADGILVTDDRIFSSYEFKGLLATMGKTLSKSLNQQNISTEVLKDIYNVGNIINLVNL